jgi:hypothetical protein
MKGCGEDFRPFFNSCFLGEGTKCTEPSPSPLYPPPGLSAKPLHHQRPMQATAALLRHRPRPSAPRHTWSPQTLELRFSGVVMRLPEYAVPVFPPDPILKADAKSAEKDPARYRLESVKKLASGAQPRSASDQQRCPGEEGQGDGGRDAECRLKGRIPHSEQSVAESIDEIEKRVEARYTFP